MKRRAFFRFLAALPLVGLLPSVRAAAGPQTVDALREAMEDLFADARDMQPVAFEEFEVPTRRSYPKIGTYVYRIVPFVWRRIGDSERDLVVLAWREFSAAAKGYEAGTLFWRRMPHLVDFFDEDAGRRRLALRYRVAVRPSDWEQRAIDGAHGEILPRFNAISDAEGSPYRSL